MLNTDEFTKRLEHLFTIYELTPSTFADKIGVQRSNISHLLSGRNKPSLDFVLKVQDVFPEVELNWLLHGNGVLKKVSPPTPHTNTNLLKQIEEINALPNIETVTNNFKEKIIAETMNKTSLDLSSSEKPKLEQSNYQDFNTNEIEKIVIFYKNGTFKSFKPD